jgi:hypothetical protein
MFYFISIIFARPKTERQCENINHNLLIQNYKNCNFLRRTEVNFKIRKIQLFPFRCRTFRRQYQLRLFAITHLKRDYAV